MFEHRRLWHRGRGGGGGGGGEGSHTERLTVPDQTARHAQHPRHKMYTMPGLGVYRTAQYTTAAQGKKQTQAYVLVYPHTLPQTLPRPLGGLHRDKVLWRLGKTQRNLVTLLEKEITEREEDVHTLKEKIRERGKTKQPQSRGTGQNCVCFQTSGPQKSLWEVHSVYGKSIVPTRSDVKVTVPLFSERNV